MHTHLVSSLWSNSKFSPGRCHAYCNNVGRNRTEEGWARGREAPVSAGGPDTQARKEFGFFGLFLLDQIISW